MTKGEAISILREFMSEALAEKDKSVQEKRLIVALDLSITALECPVVFNTCAGCVDSDKCKRKGRLGVCDDFKLNSDETGEPKPEVLTAILDAAVGHHSMEIKGRLFEGNNEPLSDEAYERLVKTAQSISDPKIRAKVLRAAERRHNLGKDDN